MNESELNTLAGVVLDAAFRVHTALGPGLLESSYEACLCAELQLLGVAYLQQVPMPLIYKGNKLSDVGYKLDLLVRNELIVEIKAVDAIAPVHHAQVLSYLRLSGRKLGLLINFNTASLRDGIHRKVNRL